MARYIFRLPDIGEGIAEAEIVAWHVKVGDIVEEDGPLADMMTDKATVEMESPVAGTVAQLGGAAGEVIAIGAPLVVIETEAVVEGRADQPGRVETGSRAGDIALAEHETASTSPPAADLREPVPRPIGASSATVLASPPVRARARRLGIDLAEVAAGEDGVIGHEALDAFLVARASLTSAAAPHGAQALPVQAPAEAAAAPPAVLAGAGEQVKVMGLRRRIAENMTASKRYIPHFTYVEEFDVTDLEALRTRINTDRAGSLDLPRLTILPFLVAAICRTLPQFQMINARFDDEAGIVTRYNAVHLGIATQTDAGLMVPVLRDAQARSLSQIATEIARLAEAARAGSAKSEELSGSTLTITSLGPLGGIATTPVINRPEVAIIGPNRIVERAVFVPDDVGGEHIAKRKLMNVSISCDHRVVDGWDAASFLQAVKRIVETPNLLLAI